MARCVEVVDYRERLVAEVHAVEHQGDVPEDARLQLCRCVSVCIEAAGVLQNDVECSKELVTLVVRKPRVHHGEVLFEEMLRR